jgi:hypothetical protein
MTSGPRNPPRSRARAKLSIDRTTTAPVRWPSPARSSAASRARVAHDRATAVTPMPAIITATMAVRARTTLRVGDCSTVDWVITSVECGVRSAK